MRGKFAWFVAAAIACGGAFAACGDEVGSTFKPDGSVDHDATIGDGDNPFGDDAGFDFDSAALVIMPQNQTITVIDGQAPPTLQFTATVGGVVIFPRFRGHPRSHESAIGVFEDETKAKVVHEGVQGGVRAPCA